MKRPFRKRIADLIASADRALPLGPKLLIPFIVVASLTVIGVAWTEYRLQREEINEGFIERGQIVARALAADLELTEEHDHFADTVHLQTHIGKVLSMDPAVLRVNIHVPSGEGVVTAASSDPSLIGREANPRDSLPLYTGTATTRETRLGDEKALAVLVPVQIEGETAASLALYVSLAERDAALQALTFRLGAAALVIALISAMIWFYLRFMVLRRLRWLVRAGEGLARGEMTSRVPGGWGNPGRDEMTTALQQFNRMAGSIQSLTAKLERLGVTDGLTGIYNRRFFDQILPREVNRCHRLGTQVALLMLDIDHFKRFNDRLGHPAGDEALRTLVQTLGQRLRAMDFVVRYGGEEFAVVLPGADRVSALATAERLRSAVESATYCPSANSDRLTVSIGVAVFPEDADDASGLLAAADAALYTAKQAGRNTVRAAETVDSTPTAG